MTETSGHRDRVEVSTPEALSLQDQAIIEFGRRLYVESDDVGRDFAKQMITVSTGAIPIYIALANLGGLSSRSAIVVVAAGLPAIVYLGSALMFVWSYRPIRSTVSLELPNEVEAARKESLDHRQRWNITALSIFVLATLASIGIVLALMATK